jgi:hypothetical protein
MRIRANFSIIDHNGRISDRFWAVEPVNGNPRKMLKNRINDAVTRVITRVLSNREDRETDRVRYEGYSFLQGETVFTSEMWGNRG